MSPPHPTAPQQWSSHHQPTKFLVQRDAAWRDDQRKIAVTFPPNYGTAKLDLMNFAVGKLNQLLRLEHGWDGLGAAQIAETTAATAIQWLDLLAEDHTFPPQIFPLPNGGVQVEWLAGGESLEIEIGPQNTIGILGLDAAGNVLVEGDYPDPRGTSDRIATAPRSVSTASSPKWVWVHKISSVRRRTPSSQSEPPYLGRCPSVSFVTHGRPAPTTMTTREAPRTP